MRRQEVEEQETKKAVAAGMEDVKKACTRCHIMKVRRREGKGGREEGCNRQQVDNYGIVAIQVITRP